MDVLNLVSLVLSHAVAVVWWRTVEVVRGQSDVVQVGCEAALVVSPLQAPALPARLLTRPGYHSGTPLDFLVSVKKQAQLRSKLGMIDDSSIREFLQYYLRQEGLNHELFSSLKVIWVVSKGKNNKEGINPNVENSTLLISLPSSE